MVRGRVPMCLVPVEKPRTTIVPLNRSGINKFYGNLRCRAYGDYANKLCITKFIIWAELSLKVSYCIFKSFDDKHKQ